MTTAREMAGSQLRYLMRKQMLQAMTPDVDYRLIGFGRVLVLIGWVAFALLIAARIRGLGK